MKNLLKIIGLSVTFLTFTLNASDFKYYPKDRKELIKLVRDQSVNLGEMIQIKLQI